MQLQEPKNDINLVAVLQAFLDFTEQTKFCLAARNAACSLPTPKHNFPFWG